MAVVATNITRVKTTRSQVAPTTRQGTGEPLIVGVDFWMIAGLALGLDIFQVVALVGHTLATGLMASATIPVIGWVLGVLTVPAGAMLNFGLILVGFLLGLTLSGTIILYCFFKNIPLGITRMGTQGLTLLAEQIPLMNILPFNTINILLLRNFENKRRQGKGGLIGKAAGLIVGATPVGRIGKIASTTIK
jgi:hypothetical protein